MMRWFSKSGRVLYDELSQWHEWFAWYPVRVNALSVAWMEKVQRRLVRVDKWEGDPIWEYRPREER